MPQLRDSGTRSLHATEPVPSAEMDGFCRIFGVETEYGVAVTGAERPVDAGQVAMTTVPAQAKERINGCTTHRQEIIIRDKNSTDSSICGMSRG